MGYKIVNNQLMSNDDYEKEIKKKYDIKIDNCKN